MDNIPLTPDGDADLEKRFNYHVPTPRKVGVHEIMRQECKALAYKIKALVPAGREQSLALTHLEDVMMWSNAAIARS